MNRYHLWLAKLCAFSRATNHHIQKRIWKAHWHTHSHPFQWSGIVITMFIYRINGANSSNSFSRGLPTRRNVFTCWGKWGFDTQPNRCTFRIQMELKSIFESISLWPFPCRFPILSAIFSISFHSAMRKSGTMYTWRLRLIWIERVSQCHANSHYIVILAWIHQFRRIWTRASEWKVKWASMRTARLPFSAFSMVLLQNVVEFYHTHATLHSHIICRSSSVHMKNYNRAQITKLNRTKSLLIIWGFVNEFRFDVNANESIDVQS